MLPPGPGHPANLTWWFPPLYWHLKQYRSTSRKIHDYSSHLCSPTPAWVDILQVGHRVALTQSRRHYGCDSLDSRSHVWYVRSLDTFKSSLGNSESTKLGTVGFKRAHGDIEGVRGSCAARRATLRILDTACSPPSSVAPQYTDLCGGEGDVPQGEPVRTPSSQRCLPVGCPFSARHIFLAFAVFPGTESLGSRSPFIFVPQIPQSSVGSHVQLHVLER